MAHGRFNVLRRWAVLALVFGLALVSIASVTILQRRADTSRVAQLRISTLKDVLNELQGAPLKSDKSTGGSPAIAHALMLSDERRITETLRLLRTGSAPASLSRVEEPIRANFAIVESMYQLGVQYGSVEKRTGKAGAAGALVSPMVVVVAFERVLASESRSAAKAIALLEQASEEYDRRASRSETQTLYGSAAAILLLFGSFWLFYRRLLKARATAEVLVRENQRLLALSRDEALTDALTELGNRRALVNRLDEAFGVAATGDKTVLVLFDLDGFKQYNDTFGHPAGDALLARLGLRLAGALGSRGAAFRMGGDEFCLLARVDDGDAERVARVGAEALSETGDAFDIGCSWGLAVIPEEAFSAEDALRLADQRMYEQKEASRMSASRQTTDVLVKVLTERDRGMHDHVSSVARLARLAAIELGLANVEVQRTELAAELHDVGKAAIPEEILNKKGPLDDEEWQFIRRHTLIGERILRAAPALAHTAELVRSSHERIDGTGYPDGLRGEEIPLGARIIAVCDAFDAMLSCRPYRDALPRETALAELRHGAGTQFDAAIVDVVCGLLVLERVAA